MFTAWFHALMFSENDSVPKYEHHLSEFAEWAIFVAFRLLRHLVVLAKIVRQDHFLHVCDFRNFSIFSSGKRCRRSGSNLGSLDRPNRNYLNHLKFVRNCFHYQKWQTTEKIDKMSSLIRELFQLRDLIGYHGYHERSTTNRTQKHVGSESGCKSLLSAEGFRSKI